MSAILAILDPSGSPLPEARVAAMLGRMRQRGSEVTEVVCLQGAALAVARHHWEATDSWAGAAPVARDGSVMVAADATLYYRGELRDALRGAGVTPVSDAPGHLIAAAYRAWGDRCLERLEGDYAFVLWDGARRRCLAARDFYGLRGLYFAEWGSALVIASTLGGVLAHPRSDDELNPFALACDIAQHVAASHGQTVYRHVRLLGAGERLTREHGRPPELSRFWQPPVFVGETAPRVPFREAALELRHLIARAAEERLAPVTSIGLSGGYDSPVIYGIAKERLRESGGDPSVLRPVTISFPKGDPGREDEVVAGLTERWHETPEWVSVTSFPAWDGFETAVPRMDEPFTHAFSGFNRALGRGARAVGSHAMLNGNGGDQFYQTSIVYLADLAARGRLVALGREWKIVGEGGWRGLVRWAALPWAGHSLRAVAARLRGGRPLRSHLDRVMPDFLSRDFVRRHALEERERAGLATPPVRGREAAERHWYLTYPFYPRIVEKAASIALEEGVEARSPLYDERVLRFAATRPRAERRSGPETKLLLREAARGLLPDSVLAPRTSRTGVPFVYFARGIRSAMAEVVPSLMADSALGDMGILDVPRFRQAVDRALAPRSEYVEGLDWSAMLQVLLAELWLQGRASGTLQKATAGVA